MIRAAAPASTANLGPGFDAAGAALDLWNELDVKEGPFGVEVSGEGAAELPRDERHLALQAFALFAPADRYRFRFVNRIPLERGLGSSAAAIALGLVAGARAAGAGPSADELLALAERFEPHLDNLAAALNGGVCVAWRDGGRPHARRIADDTPAAVVAVVPTARTSTHASRAALPEHVPHGDAAATAGAALLLGAALAAGDASLLGPALRDRLHEPYRAATAPLLGRVRELAPPGLVGITLSGSGPTVIAWVERSSSGEATALLRESLGTDATVLPLAVADRGASA